MENSKSTNGPLKKLEIKELAEKNETKCKLIKFSKLIILI